MVRQRDRFWEYAEDLKGRFVCKFCRKDYPGGIARVKSHLSRQQGRDIAICNSVPEDVQALAFHAVFGKDLTPYKKRKTSTCSTNIERNGADSMVSPILSCPDSSTVLHQTTLPTICNKKDKDLVDRMVAQAFIMNNIALGAIQSPSFVAMVKAIAEFGASYSLPNHSTLCTKLVQDSRKDIEEYVSNVKDSWSLTGCSLMLDTWTDMKDVCFINVVAYSPKGAVFLKNFERSDKGKTEVSLGDILLSVIDEIGPENVVQIVVNNVSNYECVTGLIMGRYPHIYKIQCVAHGVQLLLEDIYKEVEWIQSVFDDAKLIVDYMYKYTTALKLMRVYTAEKEIKRPCNTRFVSHFMMLQSILEVEENLRLMIVSSEWRDMSDNSSPLTEKITQMIKSTTFWSRGEEVISVLEPLITVLRLVDGEGSTAGYLYEAMERVRTELGQHCNSDSLKYLKVWELFESKRNGDIIHKIHAAAAFLNPSLMYDGKIKYEQPDIRDGMNYVVESMVDPNEMDDFAAQLLLYNGKSPKLFNTLSILMMKKAHPRVWWEYNGGEVPLLRKVAIRILSQPCSSSTCGRNWSAFEVAKTKKINKLSPDILEDLVYTRMNSKMMTYYNELEMRDKFAISVENLGELPKDIDDGFEKFDDEEFSTNSVGDTLMPDDMVGAMVGAGSSSHHPNNVM